MTLPLTDYQEEQEATTFPSRCSACKCSPDDYFILRDGTVICTRCVLRWAERSEETGLSRSLFGIGLITLSGVGQ
jgi:hypothetical protein